MGEEAPEERALVGSRDRGVVGSDELGLCDAFLDTL